MRILTTLAAFAMAGLSACSGKSAATTYLLPFHVAVVPVGIVQQEAPVEPGRGRTLHIDLAEPVLSATLTSTLAELCFARTTLLALPAGVAPEDFEGWTAQQQIAHWQERAKSVGADLILESSFTYDPLVDSRINRRFWPNLLLFFVGGPFCWFIGDRDYDARRARLEASLHDLGAMNDVRKADLLNKWARIQTVLLDFDGTSLDLLQRSGGHVQHYFYSIFVPPAFLARESSVTHARLAREIVQDLCEDVATEISERREQILRAERLVAFRPEDVHAVTHADGRWKLAGTIHLELLADGVSGMDDGFVYWSGDAAPVWSAFESEGVVDLRAGERHAFVRYAFALPAASAEVEEVRVEFQDARGNARSFTFRLDQLEALQAEVFPVEAPRGENRSTP